MLVLIEVNILIDFSHYQERKKKLLGTLTKNNMNYEEQFLHIFNFKIRKLIQQEKLLEHGINQYQRKKKIFFKFNLFLNR